MQHAFSHTSRERKGKRGANKEPSIPSRSRLSLTHCHLPGSLVLFISSEAFPCSSLTMALGWCCAAQPGAGCAGAEWSMQLSSLSLWYQETGGKHLPCNASPVPTASQLRDGATLGNFAWIGSSMLYFFLLIHPVSHANFLGHVSVWRSCLGCILWSAVPSAISSSPGFHDPPCTHLLAWAHPPRLSWWNLAVFGTADLGMVYKPAQACPCTCSLCLSAADPEGLPHRSWWTLPQDGQQVPVPKEPPAAFSTRRCLATLCLRWYFSGHEHSGSSTTSTAGRTQGLCITQDVLGSEAAMCACLHRSV